MLPPKASRLRIGADGGSWEKRALRRIVANPEILGGEPILEGTRLSVAHILDLLAHGISHAEVVDSRPELSIADVNNVVQYAAETLQNEVLIEVHCAG